MHKVINWVHIFTFARLYLIHFTLLSIGIKKKIVIYLTSVRKQNFQHEQILEIDMIIFCNEHFFLVDNKYVYRYYDGQFS